MATLALADRTFERVRARIADLVVPAQRAYVEAERRRARTGVDPDGVRELLPADELGRLVRGWLAGAPAPTDPAQFARALFAGRELAIAWDDAAPLEWKDRMFDAIDTAQATLHALVGSLADDDPVLADVVDAIHDFCLRARRA